MPSAGLYKKYTRRGWELMERWEKKQFHRENESRARKNLPPLPKPTTIHCGGAA